MAAKKLLIDDKITACVKQTCLLGVVVKQFAFLKTRLVSIFKFVLPSNCGATTASGNVASMREPLDGSLWWYWIAANAAKKNGASFKNYHRRPSS